MITRLTISNYALIDALDIAFTPGLNIITGETGAGKSIMLGALSLLLGARADSRAIRSAERKSVVEATFSVAGLEGPAAWAAANDVDWDPEEAILRREITPAGRSRAFVNDTPVTLAQLAELGRGLIDIHSQNQNQLLATPEYQLQVIDAVGENAALLGRYRGEYAAWRAAEKKYNDALRTLEQNRVDEEFIRFQLAQLDEAQLIEGEQEDLESERELQANMTQIKQTLRDALGGLSEGDANILGLLSDAVEATEELGEVLEGAAELAGRLESARLEIQDIAETLGAYDANLAADPAALDAIEERLETLYGLQGRHRVESVGELIAIRDSLRAKLEAIDGGDLALDELKAEALRLKKVAAKTAKELTLRRREAAGAFAAELLEAARPLGMPNLRVEIAVDPAAPTATGADRVEFRFAFNKNQEPTAVGGAASGGEVSRLMLSVKSIVAGRLQLPSIIFDEVDTGVSGDVANRMGRMMLAIAGRLQVITITHLPQVAALGASHYKVFKEDDAEATHTRIRRLGEEERPGELALMLSGDPTEPAALATAKSLMTNNYGKI